jgi:hypothetical protein
MKGLQFNKNDHMDVDATAMLIGAIDLVIGDQCQALAELQQGQHGPWPVQLKWNLFSAH